MGKLSLGKGPDIPFEGVNLFVHPWDFSLVLGCFAQMLSMYSVPLSAFTTHENDFTLKITA